MFKHSWKVSVPITIVVIFGMGIGYFAIMNSTDLQYRFLIELKDWLKIETEFNKGQDK